MSDNERCSTSSLYVIKESYSATKPVKIVVIRGDRIMLESRWLQVGDVISIQSELPEKGVDLTVRIEDE